MFTNFETHTPNHISFEITDVDLSIVNALRRIVLSEIPNVALAFDPLLESNPDITFKVNTSPLHNEFLGHRLSLIPICLSHNEIDAFERDKYKFVLKVKNTGTEVVSVTTKDIVIYDSANKRLPPDFHARVFPINPTTKQHILIVKLRPNLNNKDFGEELDIEWYASKNVAQIHSRWAPVSCCSMWNKIDETKAQHALMEKLAGVQAPDQINAIKQRFETLEKYRHFVVNEYDEPCHFHFQVESECAMTPTYIFGKAMDVLLDKLSSFRRQVEEANGVEIIASHTNHQMFDVSLENETFTITNVLQSMIYNHAIRDKMFYKPSAPLSYIGYFQPHPLDNKMVIKLKFDNAVTIEQVKEFLVEQIQHVVVKLQDSRAKWDVASASI